MSIWIQITSGRGPMECSRAVYLASEAIRKELDERKVAYVLLEAVPDIEKETFKSVTLSVPSVDPNLMRDWEGTIQWICPSPFRPAHKRKNWFIGVTVLQPPELVPFHQSEITVETCRASGPGGQHVNTSDSAVRVTHVPTGLVAVATEERSQTMNKKLAMARLMRQLETVNSQNERAARQERWDAHNSLERGSPVKVFRGPVFRQG